MLSVLDVLLGFIVSTGGDKEKLIHDYLHSTLRMPEDQGLVSPKARQHCRLKHVLSLWRIAAVEKGKRLALNYQVIFAGLLNYSFIALLIGCRILLKTFLPFTKMAWTTN